MEARDPNYRKVVEAAFAQAGFIADVGIQLDDCGPGWCESGLRIAPRHLQHTGVIHAGVQTTMADHTAGTAAMTLLPEGQYVLTVELKIHLLRAGLGESLWCRAQVLKPGSMFHVVESEVYALAGDKKTLVSKLTATMAVLAKK